MIIQPDFAAACGNFVSNSADTCRFRVVLFINRGTRVGMHTNRHANSGVLDRALRNTANHTASHLSLSLCVSPDWANLIARGDVRLKYICWANVCDMLKRRRVCLKAITLRGRAREVEG